MIRSWLIITGITWLVAFGSFLIRPRDLRWASHLDRPKWLIFERAIPLIWAVIFICGATSATLVWQAQPGYLTTGLLMALYLLLEVVTVAYIPATLRLHSLAVGTLLGGVGIGIGLLLAGSVWSISHSATLLLLPYLIWSPIGTYTTRRMIDLNPDAL